MVALAWLVSERETLPQDAFHQVFHPNKQLQANWRFPSPTLIEAVQHFVDHRGPAEKATGKKRYANRGLAEKATGKKRYANRGLAEKATGKKRCANRGPAEKATASKLCANRGLAEKATAKKGERGSLYADVDRTSNVTIPPENLTTTALRVWMNREHYYGIQ
jgi:hypothetical protein